MHKCAQLLLHIFVVTYFVALCSSSLWHRSSFDLQVYWPSACTDTICWILCNHGGNFNKPQLIYAPVKYIFIYIVEYPSYIFCIISFILATQCTITSCRYSQNLMNYSTWFVTNCILIQMFNAWWKRLCVPKIVCFQCVDRVP